MTCKTDDYVKFSRAENDYKSRSSLQENYSSFGYKKRSINRMSKLAIVLCATVIFTLATAASLERQNETEVLPFDQLIEKIESRVAEVNQQAFDLPPESRRMNFHVAEEYIKNSTDIFQQVLVFLEKIMNGQKARGTKFNETVCNSYLNDFEETQAELLAELDDCIYGPLFKVMEPLTNLLGHQTTEAKTKIKNLENEADACEGDACNGFAEDANSVFNEYMSDSKEILDKYLATINESRIRDDADARYQHLIGKANEVLNQTLDCTYAYFRYDSESFKSDPILILGDVNTVADKVYTDMQN